MTDEENQSPDFLNTKIGSGKQPKMTVSFGPAAQANMDKKLSDTNSGSRSNNLTFKPNPENLVDDAFGS